MTRIALALTFPLRYYAYLTAVESRVIAAAPLQDLRNDSHADESEAA